MLIWVVFGVVLLLGLFFRHPHFLQDVHFVVARLRLRRLVRKYAQANYLYVDRFSEVVKAQPHKTLLLFNDETYTYQEADELSNKAARVFLQNGVKAGDTVALFLGNEPMFMWLWFGLAKIGCPAAFLNCNIRSKSLLHCLSCSGATTLVAAEELQDAVEEVLPSLLEQQITVFLLADRCKNADVHSFKDKMSKAASGPVSKELRSHVTLASPAVYIYTSGTTGLPKAAPISNGKLWNLILILPILGLKSSDTFYTTLPLYHSAGFVGCIGAIERGVPVALRRKFSASQFWDDCRKYNITVIQYIGEIMRYLCNTPKKPNDRNHKVRLALGNGIRADVWRDFLSRFGNIGVKEFYGATEGNFVLVNNIGKIGAVGRNSFLLKWYFPYSVIKYDVDSEKPMRDSAGFCIEAEKGEPGLLVCEISVNAPFSGYARNLQQTEKKRLHNVHKEGDLYFNTGDLLTIGKDDFFYFHDRVGDTFRWKGENVSTNEVADIITGVECIKEANVYGVAVPAQEGRVGMAAIMLNEGQGFDSAAVFKHVEQFLPAYARPRFIRIQGSFDVTGTFKYMKTKLVEQGFDPNQITEALYFLDEREKNYVPLTQDMFNSVTSGKIKI